MANFEEQISLIHSDLKQETNNRRSNRPDLNKFCRNDNNYYLDEGSWLESESSSCSSFFTESHTSSTAEWENETTPSGELFYIESFSKPKQQVNQEAVDGCSKRDINVPSSTEGPKLKNKTKGKLVRLIRKRSSRRSTFKKLIDSENRVESEMYLRSGGNKVTFSESQKGEIKEVTLRVPVDGSSLGRRATLTESLLGLVLSTFSDNTRIMIAGVIPNSEASKERNIKVGDWLKSINEEEISRESLNTVVKKIKPPCDVLLKLQCVAKCDVTQANSSDELTGNARVEQSELVSHIVEGRSFTEGEEMCLLYSSQECVTEDGPADQGLLYTYPSGGNILNAARGAFVTINHLLLDIIKAAPISTSVCHKNEMFHVIYTFENKELLLLAVPSSRCTLEEAVLLNTDVVRALRFSYQTLFKCFSNKDNHIALDRFFSLLQGQFFTTSSISLDRFEDRLSAAHLTPLPRDAQVQIDEALSELESNDFGGYNSFDDDDDEDDDFQRLYSIIGSCIFYKSYLLSSHLSREDLMDVNAFCRHNGLLSLTRAESVKSIVVWKESYPASCSRGVPSTTSTLHPLPNSRWFLLLVGQEEALLAVLLESGGCTINIEGNPGPEPVYIKQAQATLQHLKEIEVFTLADKWISSHCRLHTASPENSFKTLSRASTDNNPGSTEFLSKSTPSPSSNKPVQEVTSILKHANIPDEDFVNASQYETSEDSTSQAASDEAAPILGRRAERQRASHSTLSLSDSDCSSDSDWNSFKDSYQDSSSNQLFDLPDSGRNMLSDVEYSAMKITTGEQNHLFCYVHFDCIEGVVLSSPNEVCFGQLKLILDNFRMITPMIHDLLQNTVRFKKLKVQEVSESLINKALIANKEHAILFECPHINSSSLNKSATLTYWIVGRLFFMPQPREVYVCYQDSSPQNLVEIAFRLALSSSG